jgi:cell division protein FtsW (lipid II flippase)
MIVTLVLVALGVLAVGTSVTPVTLGGTSITSFMLRDLVYVTVGLLAFAAACRAPMARFARASFALLVVADGLLLVVRVMGSTTSGGRRWLDFGSLSVQPSEFFTLAAVFYLATAIARRERASRDWIDLLKSAGPVLVGVALIFMEPDMGTASVVLMVMFGLFVLAGLPWRAVLITVLAGGVALGAAAAAAPYRLERLLVMFHTNCAQSAAYQVCEARIGLGAGGVAGQGISSSPLKWGLLPNPHTDFIFAIVGEQFGFIGSTVLLALFVALIALGASVARRSPDREGQLLAAGITLWFGIEAFINVASVVGWWPVTGIPLPLISYGGTSLIIDLVALGLLVNIARRINTNAASGNVRVMPSAPTHVPRETARRQQR